MGGKKYKLIVFNDNTRRINLTYKDGHQYTFKAKPRKPITKEYILERIDYLLNLANQINGNWDKDELIFGWNSELRSELNKLFKNLIEINANLNLKGRFDSDLGIELTKIVTPDNYDKKRKERSENNKIVFLHQLSVLLIILEKLKLI